MEDQYSTATHHAILIGIDDYPEKRLRSGVRDVEAVRSHLQQTLQDTVEMQMITTSQTRDVSSEPSSSPTLWPTYDNVISTFSRITALAHPGDFVYIHYSGHGSRKPPSGAFSDRSTGDLALVLLHPTESRVSYLWGYELARMLKALVDKGLVVTLVLDCCFAASVYRHDDEDDSDDLIVRFLPYDAEVGLERPHPPVPAESLASGGPAYRDASALPNFLIDPDRHAIVAACGPHEVAMEPKFNGQRHGALSYFLLEAVQKVGLERRHRDIYAYVHAKFKRSGLRHQNPVLYGNQHQGFFGRADSAFTAVRVPVVVTGNSVLELQAGEAHGVCGGDQFTLYPFSPTRSASQSQGSSVASRIIRIGALTSQLELLGATSIDVRTAWVAEPITRIGLRGFHIRLPLDLPCRDEFFAALQTRSLVDTHSDPFALEVVLNGAGEFQVRNECGHDIANLPTIPRGPTSVTQVSDILEHLARFRHVRDLGKGVERDSYLQNFDINIETGGRTYSPGARLETKSGAMADLVLKNRGVNAFYAVVLDLGPSWQVENIFKGTFSVVTPRNDRERFVGTRRIKLRMRVPDNMKEQGHRSCEDVIKVLVTSRPTSFDLFELPRLGEPAKVKEPERTDKADASPEDWVAMNFYIRTSL